MTKFPERYQKVEGKTYTLFGNSNNTSHFYEVIEKIADEILIRFTNIKFVLETIQNYSRKKKLLEKIAKENENKSLISFVMHQLNQ